MERKTKVITLVSKLGTVYNPIAYEDPIACAVQCPICPPEELDDMDTLEWCEPHDKQGYLIGAYCLRDDDHEFIRRDEVDGSA